MSGDSDNSSLPVSDIAEPAAPVGQVPPAGQADTGSADGGKEPRVKGKKRGNPWDTFGFKRFRGLERTARKPSAPE
jgi:hypothetical protein